MTSGWFINDLELPEPPTEDTRGITRTFQSESLFNFFPDLTKSTAQGFDYSIKTFIYPQALAFELDELSKGADTDIVSLTIPDADKLFEGGSYAIKAYKINRKGPMFLDIEGEPTQVFPLEITFTERPAEGETDTIIEGDQTVGEEAVGAEALPEVVEEAELPEDIEEMDWWDKLFLSFAVAQAPMY